MAVHALKPHPAEPPSGELAVTAEASREGAVLRLRFELRDPDGIVFLPDPASGERRDGLWQTSCFEAFIQPAGSIGYHEFNLSPSGNWASYSFDAHRAGMRDAPGLPVIERTDDGMTVAVDLSNYPDLAEAAWHVGLTTVIEEKGGTKSYWALKHPEGAPDFHDATCFALQLPATA